MSTQTKSANLLVCHKCGAVNRVPVGRNLSEGTCGKCGAALATSVPIDLDGNMFTRLRARDTGAYVVDAWAPWCGPCRMMAPAFEAAATEMSDRIRFFKLNIDDNQQVAAALGIRSVPTLIAFGNGVLVAQQAGALQGTALGQWIRYSFESKGIKL